MRNLVNGLRAMCTAGYLLGSDLGKLMAPEFRSSKVKVEEEEEEEEE